MNASQTPPIQTSLTSTNQRKMSFQEAALVVKQGLDIVDVVSREVMLKKTGRNYKGLCPFHKDKNPSFNVNPAKQIYKCFSCGEGGDTLSFIMKTQNKTYGELIIELALEQGILVEDSKHGKSSTETKALRDQLYETHTIARDFYRKQCVSMGSAKAYYDGRGIPDDVQDRFGLGYAPPGWDNLINHIKANHPQYKEHLNVLEKGGLANMRQENNPYGGGYFDRFRDRMIIPIHDDRGRVIAFGGRTLDEEKNPPKYLNSPESPIYHKSKVLYGFHLAKDAIQNSGEVVIMEGYFDVIRAHMAGLTQSVGVCGTAMTLEHLKLLTRHQAQRLYLCFDGDEAGQQAILRTIEQIEAVVWDHGLQIKVVSLPGAKDPDEYFRAVMAGSEPVEAVLERLKATAQDFLMFKFNRILAGVADRHSSHGRIEATRQLVPHLARIVQPVVLQEYVQWCANAIGVGVDTLQMELKRYKSNNFEGVGANHAILPLQERYLPRQQNSRSSSDFRREGPRRGSGSQRRYDDVSSLRASLAVRSQTDALAKKEDELMAWLLMNPTTLTTVNDRLQSTSLSTGTASSFFAQVRSQLAQMGQAIDDGFDVNGLVDRLSAYWHEENEAPMIAYLANRLMELESLAQRYNVDDTQLQSNVDRAKLVRIIHDIANRIDQDQHRQHLLNLAQQGRSHHAQTMMLTQATPTLEKSEKSEKTEQSEAVSGHSDETDLEVQLLLREALSARSSKRPDNNQSLQYPQNQAEASAPVAQNFGQTQLPGPDGAQTEFNTWNTKE